MIFDVEVPPGDILVAVVSIAYSPHHSQQIRTLTALMLPTGERLRTASQASRLVMYESLRDGLHALLCRDEGEVLPQPRDN